MPCKVDKNVKREILNMSRTNHPAVITLLDLALTEEQNHIALVLQKASGGELFSLVATRGKLSEEEGRVFLQQIVLGVEHLHNSGIFHRDLKLENILLSADHTRCFIADLGYSKSSYDSSEQIPWSATAFT
jgi:5'-AMP-activated protein kinase catalytic alpha subunit